MAVACAAGCWLLPPWRYEVDGLSMAPALLPGDTVSSGWLPRAGRLFPPRRFERWIVSSPDGRPAIKRLCGLPGEAVAIADGDLAIDGTVVLTPPHVLAALASPAGECLAADGPWQRAFDPAGVRDDVGFAPHESRRLLPVRDVGLAAVIDAVGPGPVDAAIRVGRRAIRWQLPSPGRHAVVAGRLDGCLVASAWSLPSGSPTSGGRCALPPCPPREWAIAKPWLASDADRPLLAIHLARAGTPIPAPEADRLIHTCTAWRDVLHLPPADGRKRWQLAADEIFVLGDFPPGSRDSRQWGPLVMTALKARLISE